MADDDDHDTKANDHSALQFTQHIPVKLQTSLSRLYWDLDTRYVDLHQVLNLVELGLTSEITVRQLEAHCATTIAGLASRHCDYSLLAGRVYMVALHRVTKMSFVEWVEKWASSPDVALHPSFVELALRHGDKLDTAIDHMRDFRFTYRSTQILARSYLLKHRGIVIETPQIMYMCTALAIHRTNIEQVLVTYDALSLHMYTHASPVLFNAGTSNPGFASCFIYQPDPSSPLALLKSLSNIDKFWMADGGVGLSLAHVPAQRYSPRVQAGVMSFIRVLDAHAAYTSASRQRRPSAATAYLPVWHADASDFVRCRTTRAPLGARVEYIFPALWIPDVFMYRLTNGGKWSLFDPEDVPQLLCTTGPQFTRMYENYEAQGLALTTMNALELWITISDAIRESGTPFQLFSDTINRKNNQSHLGMIPCGNLCTEIVQYSSLEETAVCTLASIALPAFLTSNDILDFEALHSTTKLAVENTDILLDLAVYPTATAERSIQSSRSIGIGVQGLADVFLALRHPFDSPVARALNIRIFETIMHAALEASSERSEKLGPYSTWKNSPAAMGKLQMDMWQRLPSGARDFSSVRSRIARHGLRNSMLIAQMPTASTAQLLGNAEGVDPYPSNVTVFRVLSGDFTEFNPWLVHHLSTRGLWTEAVRNAIIADHGSIQRIPKIPADLKELHRTVWELDPKDLLDMAADRGPYIDQSQSTVVHLEKPTSEQLLRLTHHAWTRGLKTGMYYLRMRAPSFPVPYGISATLLPRAIPNNDTDTNTDNDADLPPLCPPDCDVCNL
ncbi:ribonucleotide reductase M1 subunit [Earliella scabrosa]|nr:ribonucleotide reductase M1 subunit [Earliella scabrosa]